METRYAVFKVFEPGSGLGMFQVMDTYLGEIVGEPTYWPLEAERTARHLNHEFGRSEMTDFDMKNKSCDAEALHETLHETENAMQGAITNAPEQPVSAETPADIAAAARHLGLKPVRAWVPDSTGKPRSATAERTKRSREKAEQQGIKQLSVLLPADLHESVKALAARVRAGEPAASVWADLSPTQAKAPTPPRQPPLESALHGWRRWLLRWLLPSELRALID
jgi:hypothetical protein